MSGYDINSLNEEQRTALLQTQGAVLVSAGAGSGKTRLLTHRVAYLIGQLHVSPYNILAITFTNKAALEMKTRIDEMTSLGGNIWISTFHSMCARILRRDIDALGSYTKDFTIYSESDSDKVIKNILAERNIVDDDIKKSLVFHLSNWKNGVLSLSEYVEYYRDENDIRKIAALIEDYEKTLRKNNALDFDDLLRKTKELFEVAPAVLEYYATRFHYVLVDEFQDTNLVQYQLVKMLSSVHKNIFVVGDEDQCIYSWRGANFQNLFNFKRDFPDCKIYKLEQNYRSSPQILKIANNVISHNVARLDKNMWTDKSGGEMPSLYNAYDERDEALFVAKNIERLHAQGCEYKDIAILMRMNALSRPLEEAFLSYNIPHRVYGGFKFYERVEIRNVIAYLRLFINKNDDISLERIINFPKRAIGDVAIAKIKALSAESEKSMLEVITGSEIFGESALLKKLAGFRQTYLDLSSQKIEKLSDFVSDVIKKFKIYEAYNTQDEEDLNRRLNIDSFVSSVKDFESQNPDATLGDFLENITLKTDNDEIGEGGAVTIATVHSVKGLEFRAVFVIGLEENIFPIVRSMKNADIEEERRLLYVALTRAEEVLFMSHCSKRYLYGGSQYQAPSRFIRELGLLSFAAPKPVSTPVYEAPKPKFFDHTAFLRKEEEEKPKIDTSRYKIGQRVFYQRYGEGTIVEISPDGMVGDIEFDDYGKKSLMLGQAKIDILEG